MLVLYWTALYFTEMLFLYPEPLMFVNREDKKLDIHTSQYNLVQYNTTFNYDLSNEHIIKFTLLTMSTKTNKIKLRTFNWLVVMVKYPTTFKSNMFTS